MFDVKTLQRIALRLGSETKRAHYEVRYTVDSVRSRDSWGTPVFAKTRAPIQTLLENTRGGRSPFSRPPARVWPAVRILIDECLPRGLARELVGHPWDCRKVPDTFWTLGTGRGVR